MDVTGLEENQCHDGNHETGGSLRPNSRSTCGCLNWRCSRPRKEDGGTEGTTRSNGQSIKLLYYQCLLFMPQGDYLSLKRDCEGFFQTRRPWYSMLSKIGYFLSSFLTSVASFLAGISIMRKNSVSAVAAIVLLFTFGFASWLMSKQKLFPYVRVYTVNRKKT